MLSTGPTYALWEYQRECDREFIWRNNNLKFPKEINSRRFKKLKQVQREPRWDTIIKLSKVKNKILHAAKENHRRSSITFSVNFSKETLQVKSKWDDMFKLLKEKKKKNCWLRILYLTKESFRMKEKLRLSQMNSWENLLPLVLLKKKY